MMSTINPKAILFDLDGTLADSLFVMKLSYCSFLKQFNCEPTDEEFDSLNGPPLQKIIKRLKYTHSLNESEDALLKNYFSIIDHVYFSVKPCNGAIHILQKAKENHCTVGVVTSNSIKRTQAWLKTVGLDAMVDFIVSGDDVKQGKPHPEPYIIASIKTSYKLTEIVAIEDSPQGAQSATEAGLRTLVLGYETGHSWPQGIEPILSLTHAMKQLW